MNRPSFTASSVQDVFIILVVSMFLVPMAVRFVGETAVGWLIGTPLTGPVKVSLSLVAILIQQVVLISLTLIYVGGPGRPGLSSFAIEPRRFFHESLRGIVFGGGLFGLNVLGSHLSLAFFATWLGPQKVTELAAREEATVMRFFQQGAPAWTILAILLLVVVSAPIAEELFFRGLAFPVFDERWPGRGAVSSAVLFSGVHLYLINFLPIFLVGYGLALFYRRRHSLIGPIVAHATLNGLVALVLYVSLPG